MENYPDDKAESKPNEDGYVSAASDAIRQTFSSGHGISTALSKDALTITYKVSRSSLSRGQVEAIMAAHTVGT
jgi:hypothetical protein